MRSHHLTRVAVALASVALIGGVAAGCGDDDDEGGEETTAAADATAVTVTAKEFTFELSATPTAETKSITFDNAGELAHAMVFAKINEGFTVEEAIKLEGGKGSAVEVAQAAAKPGATGDGERQASRSSPASTRCSARSSPRRARTTSSASSRSSRSSSRGGAPG